VDSFNDLRNWCLENPKRVSTKFNTSLGKLVIGCDWFGDVRAIRDSLIHSGKHIETKLVNDRIVLFQRFHGFDPYLINRAPDIVRFKGGEWLDLQAYTGFYMGLLLTFLDKLALHLFVESGLYRRDLIWEVQRVSPTLELVGYAQKQIAIRLGKPVRSATWP